MPALINPMHEAFAQAFVRGETAGNKAHSYLAAGYRCGAGSAKTCGARLAKDPDVMRRIAELRQDMQAREAEASERAIARLAITKEAVLTELAHIAFANILDYGKPDGDGGFAFDLCRLDRDKAAAVQEVVVTPVSRSPKGGKPAQRVRIKLAPKREALVDLGRHFGLFVPRSQGLHHGSQAADDYADLSQDELTARIRTVVADLQRIGIDVASLFGIGDAARPH